MPTAWALLTGAAGNGSSSLAVLRWAELDIWSLTARERIAVSKVSTSKVEGDWKPYAMVGERVALARRAGAATKIHVVGLNRAFDVPGHIEPEAFSPDGSK